MNKNLQLQRWVEEKHTCERCGKVMLNKYASGRFCCSECVHKRKQSEVTKHRIQNGVNAHLMLFPNRCNQFGEFKNVVNKIIQPRICVICGNSFTPNRTNNGTISRTTACSKQCADALRIERSRESALKLIAEGRHNGWISRNIHSYAENFWEKVLINNMIPYIQEKTVRCDNTNYFLDFALPGNIDLEIDGGQHKREERQASDQLRDKRLTLSGYTVYRIDWVNPNNEERKQKVKE